MSLRAPQNAPDHEGAPQVGAELEALRASHIRLIALIVAGLAAALVYGRVAGLVYPEYSDFALEFGNHPWYHALGLGDILGKYFTLGHGWYRPTGFYLLPYLFRIDYFQPAEQVALDIAALTLAATMVTFFFARLRAPAGHHRCPRGAARTRPLRGLLRGAGGQLLHHLRHRLSAGGRPAVLPRAGGATEVAAEGGAARVVPDHDHDQGGRLGGRLPARPLPAAARSGADTGAHQASARVRGAVHAGGARLRALLPHAGQRGNGELLDAPEPRPRAELRQPAVVDRRAALATSHVHPVDPGLVGGRAGAGPGDARRVRARAPAHVAEVRAVAHRDLWRDGARDSTRDRCRGRHSLSRLPVGDHVRRRSRGGPAGAARPSRALADRVGRLGGRVSPWSA